MRSPPRSRSRRADAVVSSVGKGRSRKNRPTRIAKTAAWNCTDIIAPIADRWRLITGVSFRHVVADVAESFLNWDSKFTKSLGLLLIRPGWLTNQFVAGRRTRYLHPLRLYLLVSIVFFLCLRFAPIQIRPQVATDMSPKDRAEVEEAMKNPAIPALVREEVLKSLAERTKTPASEKAGLARSAEIPSPSPAPVVTDDSSREQLDDKSSPSWLKRKVKENIGPHGSNAQLLIKTLRDNFSTMMLFCIPLFALVLKVLYLRQRRFYIEHLVYALHIHSFFYIAILLTVFSAMAASRWARPWKGRSSGCACLRSDPDLSLDPAGLSPELVGDDV